MNLLLPREPCRWKSAQGLGRTRRRSLGPATLELSRELLLPSATSSELIELSSTIKGVDPTEHSGDSETKIVQMSRAEWHPALIDQCERDFTFAQRLNKLRH